MSSRQRKKSAATDPPRLRPVLLGLVLVYSAIVLAAPFTPTESLFHALLCYAPPMLLSLPLVIAAVPAIYMLLRRRRPMLQLLTNSIIALVCGQIYTFEINLPQNKTDDSNLTVLTCNILFTTREVPTLVKYIKEQEVDLIFLQENEGKSDSPANYLKQKLPDYHLFTDGSTAILSRWPLSDTKSIQQRSLEQRKILTAKVNSPTPFRAATMHWSVPQISRNLKNFRHSIPMQIDDCDQLISVLEGEQLPLIFGGDFNNPPRHGLTRKLRRNYTNAFSEVGSGPGITFSSTTPFVRIDHLYTNEHIKPVTCMPGPSFGSDHLSLIGRFRLSQ